MKDIVSPLDDRIKAAFFQQISLIQLQITRQSLREGLKMSHLVFARDGTHSSSYVVALDSKSKMGKCLISSRYEQTNLVKSFISLIALQRSLRCRKIGTALGKYAHVQRLLLKQFAEED